MITHYAANCGMLKPTAQLEHRQLLTCEFLGKNFLTAPSRPSVGGGGPPPPIFLVWLTLTRLAGTLLTTLLNIVTVYRSFSVCVWRTRASFAHPKWFGVRVFSVFHFSVRRLNTYGLYLCHKTSRGTFDLPKGPNWCFEGFISPEMAS